MQKFESTQNKGQKHGSKIVQGVTELNKISPR